MTSKLSEEEIQEEGNLWGQTGLQGEIRSQLQKDKNFDNFT